MNKVGIYPFMAEPFHCDFSGKLFWGNLGNMMLNAADFHIKDKGFSRTLQSASHRAWVLSRLAIEMNEIPTQYTEFNIETWVEGSMRQFTNRNFRIIDNSGKIYGYGRSVWALIDTETRQPTDIYSIQDGAIKRWSDPDKECPIDKCGRIKVSKDAAFTDTVKTHYSDVDLNGHINSIKYIEHILDLWPTSWYKTHQINRLEIAYVAESYAGNQLSFYSERSSEDTFSVRITRPGDDGQPMEVVRCLIKYSKNNG